MATKKLTTAQKAKNFFTKDCDNYGPWFVGILVDGFNDSDDGRCDMAVENPDDAKHARAITKRVYSDYLRENFIQYLKTPKGAKNFKEFTDATYDALTEDTGDEDE